MANELVLRQDQAKAMMDLRGELRSHQSVLLQAATGFGKTIVGAEMAFGAQRKAKRVIFGVHRRELARQTALTFDRFGISYGYIAAGMTMDPFATVQIASADTIAKRPNLLACDLFVPDEAHLWVAPTRRAVLDTTMEKGAMVVGLSATPERLDGRPLGDIFKAMVHGPSVRWLIDQGHLSNYRAFAPNSPDLTGLRKKSDGDFSTSEVEARVDKPAIHGDAIKAHKRWLMGKRTIVFACSRAHGRHLCAAYNEAGISAVYIDGVSSDGERRAAILSFAHGRAEVLINVDLCIEGFDLSAQVGFDVPVEAVSLQRPTASLPRAMQMVGRALRKKDYPALIIDHVNLFRDHGYPDDDRAWSLEGVSREERDKLVLTRTCPKCFGSFKPGPPRCPYCGDGVDIGEGRKVEEVAAEMVELDLEAVRRSRKVEVARAETLEQLAAVAISQGHKAGWICHLMKARGKPVPSWDDVERAVVAARMKAHERNRRPD